MTRRPYPATLRRQLAQRFQVLGQPVRLELLDTLRGGEMTVGDLVAATGHQQANVSRHLGVLHEAGLVARRREGTFIYYGVADRDLFTLCDLAARQLAREGTRR